MNRKKAPQNAPERYRSPTGSRRAGFRLDLLVLLLLFAVSSGGADLLGRYECSGDGGLRGAVSGALAGHSPGETDDGRHDDGGPCTCAARCCVVATVVLEARVSAPSFLPALVSWRAPDTAVESPRTFTPYLLPFRTPPPA